MKHLRKVTFIVNKFFNIGNMKTQKNKSRFIKEDEDGVSHASNRQLTKEDEKEAAKIWEKMTGKR